MELEVQVLDPRLLDWGFPAYASTSAAGMDLFACVDNPVVLKPSEPPKLISSGLAISIGNPEWCGVIAPRSGMGHQRGLLLGNTLGIVDPDYTGPCLISAWNRNLPSAQDSNDIFINPGDRIAQLVLVRIMRPVWKVVETLTKSTERGRAGFGSTGV